MFSPSIETIEICETTNELARNYLLEGGRAPKWFVAKRQTKGRGRLGRVWFDDEGNFMGSLGFTLSQELHGQNALPFITSLAIYDTIKQLVPALDKRTLILKWPNDVLLQDGKVSGCLIETVDCSKQGELIGVVIGVGVNVAHAPTISNVETIALASLNKDITLAKFGNQFIQNMSTMIDQWQKGELCLADILTSWQSLSYPLGSPISVKQKDKTIVGQFAGLGSNGCLCLTQKDGELSKIYFGDVNSFGS